MSGFRITKPEKLKRYVKPMIEREDGSGFKCVGLLHSERGDQYEPAPRDAWEPVDDYEPVVDPRRPGEQDMEYVARLVHTYGAFHWADVLQASHETAGRARPAFEAMLTVADGLPRRLRSGRAVIRVTAAGWEASYEGGPWRTLPEDYIPPICAILLRRQNAAFWVLDDPAGFAFEIYEAESMGRDVREEGT